LDYTTREVFKGIAGFSDEDVSLRDNFVFSASDLLIVEELTKIKQFLLTAVTQYKKFFWFEGNVFVILRSDNKPVQVKFNKTATEPTSAYYLMVSLVFLLEQRGSIHKDGWLEHCIDRQEILDQLKVHFQTSTIPLDYLKNLKGNLIKKIETDGEGLIRLTSFDRTKGGYPFGLKYPNF